MIVLELGRPPAEPLSTNEERRMGGRGGWARSRARLAPWRQLATIVATDARLAAAVDGTPCCVTVRIPFRDNRRRDPSNYTATVVKAVVDGLVAAKVWPDDNPRWVTVMEPQLVVDPTGRTPAAVILEARPGPEQLELPAARPVDTAPTGEVL